MSDVRAQDARPSSAEAFLTWPGDGEAKRYQLVDGVVLAMAPGSAFHGLLQATFASVIRDRLRSAGSVCKVLTEPAVKPRLHADANVRVPDIGVTCSPIAAGQIIIDDPLLLVEILSPSNRAKTWINVWAYTTLPSLREIVVVHSDRIEVQILRCSADRIWPDNPLTILAGGTVGLESISLTCPIEEIYADVPLG